MRHVSHTAALEAWEEIKAMLSQIEFGDVFTDMFGSFFSFLPRLLGAVIIFLVGWFIAKFLTRLIARVLKSVGVDRLVDRSGLGGPLERAGYPDSADFLAKILYIMIMLVVASLAINTLGIEQLQSLFDQLIAWIPKAFVAILILFVVGAIANFVRDFLGGILQAQSWGNLATNIAVGAIWFLGVTMALDQIEIAGDIIDTLFSAVMASLVGVMVIKFGVGGIWAARDRFWPSVYNTVGDATKDTSH